MLYWQWLAESPDGEETGRPSVRTSVGHFLRTGSGAILGREYVRKKGADTMADTLHIDEVDREIEELYQKDSDGGLDQDALEELQGQLEESLVKIEELRKEEDVERLWHMRWRTCMHLFGVCGRLHDEAGEEKWLRAAAKTAEEGGRRWKSVRLMEKVTASCITLAPLQKRCNRPKDAIRTYRRAIRNLEKLLELNPQTEYRS